MGCMGSAGPAGPLEGNHAAPRHANPFVPALLPCWVAKQRRHCGPAHPLDGCTRPAVHLRVHLRVPCGVSGQPGKQRGAGSRMRAAEV